VWTSGLVLRVLAALLGGACLVAHHAPALMCRLIMAIFFSRWRLRHHTHHPGAEGYGRLADLVDGRDPWWLYETFCWQ